MAIRLFFKKKLEKARMGFFLNILEFIKFFWGPRKVFGISIGA